VPSRLQRARSLPKSELAAFTGRAFTAGVSSDGALRMAAALVLMLPAACAAQLPPKAEFRLDQAAPTEEVSEERQLLGWRCVRFDRLPDKARATLVAPTIYLPDSEIPEGSPTGYGFDLYRDSELDQTIESSASWNNLGDELDLASLKVLYFIIKARLNSRSRLLFRAPDGTEIRVSSESATIESLSPSNQASVKITDTEIASRFLRNLRYEVFVERSSGPQHVGSLHLFSFAEASTVYLRMVQSIRADMADPEKHCTEIRASENTLESII